MYEGNKSEQEKEKKNGTKYIMDFGFSSINFPFAQKIWITFDFRLIVILIFLSLLFLFLCVCVFANEPMMEEKKNRPHKSNNKKKEKKY